MLPLLHTTTDSPWQWSLHPDVLLLCVAMVCGYWYAVTTLRDRISDAGRARRGQVAWFMGGVLVLWAGAGTPIHDISESYLLSVHMFQHFLFTMIAAPMLIAGLPVWLVQYPLRDRRILAAARAATKPLLAFSVFNGLLLLTHLPATMDLALRYHLFHFGVHVALVASALLMWWPIMSNVPELPRLSYPLQMAYLFVQSLLPTVLASFVTFAEGAVYEFYASTPRIWGISPVADQQIAGGVMKTLGALVIWGFIGVAFFRWYHDEQAASTEPYWHEVEGELEEMGLAGPR